MSDYAQVSPEQEIYMTGIIYDLKSVFAYLLRVTDLRKAKGETLPSGNPVDLAPVGQIGG